ncbi:hypothetical protein [Actinomadura flavalba]|uniref:hypothetical protein n=1 Tax=Actinomadura flavalba TaxID=1120938 RepID=UPI00037CC63F|nr:hypothetical protein [Actinomadura flavalba]
MANALFHNISARLREASDGEALVADGFDDALIGSAEGWFGNSRRVVALYDLAHCFRALTNTGMAEEEAAEWIDYNVSGAHVGPFIPVFAIVRRQPLIVDSGIWRTRV